MVRSPDEAQAQREAKLPRWARWEIDRLRQDLSRAQRELAVGPKDSNTFAGDRPLGEDAHIEFRLGDRETITARIERRRNGGRFLYVASNDGQLIVQPQSSNVIKIASGEWL